jgi:stage V sporulation protein R
MNGARNAPAPTHAEILDACEQIWDVAWAMGLRPFPMHYEIVPSEILYEFGAYGMPGRFSHWSHGKSYQKMKTEYDYGLSKIYELVVNTDPCYAFLLDSNSLIENKLIIAHVLAHSDFFANNAHFTPSSRGMLDTMPLSAERIRGYAYRHGTEAVEAILDAALAIEMHLDPRATTYKRRPIHDDDGKPDPLWRPDERPSAFDDVWAEKAPAAPIVRSGPPARDLLLFIADHSPEMEEWQRDICRIVRDEMLYFRPQMLTKIQNEGWATFWHVQILRALDLTDAETFAWTAMHGGVVQPGVKQMNPYYLGYKILQDIEKRWGEEGKAPEKGREKLFEVRELESDASLIRNYLTKELVEELDLFTYTLDKERNEYLADTPTVENERWKEVRDAFAHHLTTRGLPVIVAEDGDMGGTRELALKHLREEHDLELDEAKKVLVHLHRLWGRTVHLETANEGKKAVLSYDGKGHTTK